MAMGKKKIKNKVNVERPPKDFSLIKAIRGRDQKKIDGEKQLYKANIKVRDSKVRKFIDNTVHAASPQSIFPGQLVMFNYFTPKTEADLKYYDAMPCTIFFGNIKTDDGPRVLGFNIHYYPPPIRYKLMDRIFDIFKPMYMESWDSSLPEEISDFNYKMLINQLQKAKLDFGIRMYIPNLMHKITPIPPAYWQKAVFSEGRFRKQTREQILNYWRNKSLGIDEKKKKEK